MNTSRWKQMQRTGGYRRKVRKVYENMQNLTKTADIIQHFNKPVDGQTSTISIEKSQHDLLCTSLKDIEEGSVHSNFTTNDFNSETGISIEKSQHDLLCTSLKDIEEGSVHSNFTTNDCSSETGTCSRYIIEDTSSDEEHEHKLEKKIMFCERIRNWALKHNISHAAIKDLLKVFNDSMTNAMPRDPRTLLRTPREITTYFVDPGQYWHNNLKMGIINNLERESEIPEHISILVNIDGLPVHKSSKQQFWPILCSIFEKPDLSPIICGIYLGSVKPKDLDAYFKAFLDEMTDMLQNGIKIRNKDVFVSFRCFVCDSPARALIKGVCNFNGKHGCLKCTIVGQYSHISHTVIFPDVDCPLRNDKDFREKKYGDHHKFDSPLLKLPIDMIEAFPVSDSLHLIDLGVMKRLLVGWRDGNFCKKYTKWRASDIETVNIYLKSCKTPTEIHRAVRGLDCLCHWKGSEYRTFFHYLSIAILPKVLKQDALQHFLTLFCAITMCSSEEYFIFLPLAEQLLKYFTIHYKDFYGIDCVTSNVHNLTHIVDEVRRFGKLETFNAYRFENKLYLIKNLLRQGNRPLSQVARRLRECDFMDNKQNDVQQNQKYPYVKTNLMSHKLVLHFKNFIISIKEADKYFLTSKKEVMETVCIRVHENQIHIYCKKFDHLKNAFDLPINSNYLNIFTTTNNLNLRSDCVCSPSDIKCKLVVTSYESDLYFVPLLHTLR